MNIELLSTNDFKKIQKSDKLWLFLEQVSEYAIEKIFDKNTKYELIEGFQKKIDGGYDYTLYLKIFSDQYPFIKKFEIFVPDESNPIELESSNNNSDVFIWENISMWKNNSYLIDTQPVSPTQPVVNTKQTSPTQPTLPTQPVSPGKITNMYPISNKTTQPKKTISTTSFFGLFGQNTKKVIKIPKRNFKNKLKQNVTILYVSPVSDDLLTIVGTNFNISDKKSYVLFQMLNNGNMMAEEKVLINTYKNSNTFTINKPTKLSGPLTLKYVSNMNESPNYNNLYSQ